VTARGGQDVLAYAANCETSEPKLAEGNAGEMPTEFLLERYAGFFIRGGQPLVFRAWHPPWLQVPLEAEILDLSLVTNRFPWFREARFAGAHFAPGFRDVWLGRAHRLKEAPPAQARRRVLSAFFEMP